MSLNILERKHTTKEFKENIKILGYDKNRIAKDLNWSEEKLEKVIHLDVDRLLDPWDLRDYLLAELDKNGKDVYPFSKLKGDRSDYWFL